MQQLKRGLLIAVEGIDGSGKSTLVRHLANHLVKKNFSVFTTQEPGGTLLGKQLRAILQKQKITLTPKAEYLLFAADRAQHFTTTIIPHLRKKELIISDRMADSSLAYQGYGRGLDRAMLQKINRWAMNNIEPDLTLYIKLSTRIALERIKKREYLTTFEQEEKKFIDQVASGFNTMYRNKKNVIHIDGTEPIATSTKLAFQAIEKWIKKEQLIQWP